MLSGFVNILKPTGVTSSDVVLKIKKILSTKKVGHLGTLDPAASGVLPIAVGNCTKFFDYFLNKDKVYVALVQFGKETETLDSFGKITNFCDKILSENDVRDAVSKFVGEISQMPPKFSAKKINGKKAYELARKNENFELKPRNITIFSIKIVKFCGKNKFLFKVHCSAGTYIRSLFNDIAKLLDTFATTEAIIRTKSGFFETDSAVTLDEFENEKKLISIQNVFSESLFLKAESNDAKTLINGQKVALENLGLNRDYSGEFFVSIGDELIGFYSGENGMTKQKVYLYNQKKNDWFLFESVLKLKK